MPWVVSMALVSAGIVFAFRAQTLFGMVCLLLGTGFAFLIWWRDTGGAKGGPRRPPE